MDDITTRPRRQRSATELARGREALRQATADAHLKGQFSTPESQKTFEAFVRGEIEFDEFVAHVEARHAQG